MKPEQRRSVEDIVQRLEGLPPDQRETMLCQLCAHDPEVRAEVSRHFRTRIGEATMPDLQAQMRSLDIPLGSMIGPYKLLSVLGEGGFGVVYLAERREPMQQRVALKIIKPGMDSKAVLTRFEAERQALALMDHANIARVFDAGATAEGRPYFVMEHVPGIPITEHCDKERLTVRQRLELFATVCDAVAHAHMKGIIHRDIKPSNILVSVRETGGGVPKIIDFGVAKATQMRLTEQTVFTEQGVLIGTPEYMSPEQAEMNAQDIDTRTDVYSLGVVLYELLTGAPPFDPRTLRDRGYEELRRLIREAEPPRPSTRLTTQLEGVKTAEARRTKLEDLAKELRAELEWIPLKAMRKDRTERYRSAEEMGEEIRRYQRGDALLAAPETARYRVSKFISRHRRGVGISAIVTGLILFGLSLIARQYHHRASSHDGKWAALCETSFLVGLASAAQVAHVPGVSSLAEAMTDPATVRLVKSTRRLYMRAERQWPWKQDSVDWDTVTDADVVYSLFSSKGSYPRSADHQEERVREMSMWTPIAWKEGGERARGRFTALVLENLGASQYHPDLALSTSGFGMDEAKQFDHPMLTETYRQAAWRGRYVQAFPDGGMWQFSWGNNFDTDVESRLSRAPEVEDSIEAYAGLAAITMPPPGSHWIGRWWWIPLVQAAGLGILGASKRFDQQRFWRLGIALFCAGTTLLAYHLIKVAVYSPSASPLILWSVVAMVTTALWAGWLIYRPQSWKLACMCVVVAVATVAWRHISFRYLFHEFWPVTYLYKNIPKDS